MVLWNVRYILSSRGLDRLVRCLLIIFLRQRRVVSTRPTWELSLPLDLIFLSSQKDILPILEQIMLVYKFQCRCEADNIGRTIQRLEVRVRQHVPRSLLNRSQELTFGCSQAQKSAIGEHLCELHMPARLFRSGILCVLYKAYSKKHLAVLESITIRLKKPSLGKQRRPLIELGLFGESWRWDLES